MFVTNIDRQPQAGWRLSPALLVAMAVSVVLGLIGGSAYLWAPERAGSLFMAMFLWTLLSATGTALARCVIERVRRGELKRGLLIGFEMSFPLTTCYLVTVALVSAGAPVEAAVPGADVLTAMRPDVLAVAPICYAATLVVALITGPLYALTSPFQTFKK